MKFFLILAKINQQINSQICNLINSLQDTGDIKWMAFHTHKHIDLQFIIKIKSIKHINFKL